MSDEVGMEYVWRSIMGVGERGGWICYKAMLRNMGINLRGGDFRGIFAVPAKKKEYRVKKSCDIIKWLLGCCGFV